MNHDGHDILVDPGAYRYSSDFAARNAFRSVEYHNTVQINAERMHEYDPETFEGLWWMCDKAQAETEFFGATPEGDVEFRGLIHAYEAGAGCRFRRRICYRTDDGQVEIEDIVEPVEGKEELFRFADATSRFLLGPDMVAELKGNDRVSLSCAGKESYLVSFTHPTVSLSIRDLWYSPRYGSRVSTKQIEARWLPREGSHCLARLSPLS